MSLPALRHRSSLLTLLLTVLLLSFAVSLPAAAQGPKESNTSPNEVQTLPFEMPANPPGGGVAVDP